MTDTQQRTASLYREAAKLIEDGAKRCNEFGACNAIWKAQHPDLTYGRKYDSEPHKFFEEMFPWNDDATFYMEQNANDLRIVALCFMAAITERP